VRVFFAVPSDPMWVESARRLVGQLREKLPRASWTRPESWHLTLHFLGEVAEDAVARFAAEIEPVAMETVPGDLIARPATVFPDRGRPRVVGVGFEPSPGLESVSSLAARGAEIAARLGLRTEDRAFHPHVTFARLREPWPRPAVDDYAREVEAWAFPAWNARSCVLFQSLLEPSGAVHTPLHEWTFQGGPRGVRA
jgi:RNA 2',3'-cyclic 3'-phosphodiesterase